MIKSIATSVYFIVPFCIAVIVLAVMIIKRCTKSLIYSKLTVVGGVGAGYVLELLGNEYGYSSVLRDVRLIRNSDLKDVREMIKPTSDVIFVGKGGVVLITVLGNKGEYDNPKTGIWRHKTKNKNGEDEIRKIPNPFDSTIPQFRIVSELLNDEGIFSKCIKRLVVSTNESSSFTYSYPEAVLSRDLVPAIARINEKSVLTNAERRAAIATLREYSDFIEN